MTETPTIETKQLANWESIVREFDNLGSSSVFRGQRDSRWALRSSLERQKAPWRQASHLEAQLISEFPKRAANYNLGTREPTTHDGWWALMQHFGAPTRLIDFTHSPYVALFFAFEEAAESQKCGAAEAAGTECPLLGGYRPKCAVWAIDENWCQLEGVAAHLRAGAAFKTLVERLTLNSTAIGSMSAEMVAAVGVLLTAPGVILANRVPAVVPLPSTSLSERMAAQQGTFLCPTEVDLPFMENLAALRPVAGALVKYEIPIEERPVVLERLRRMNITRASLFPGLDGYAQSFRHLLVEEDPEHLRDRIVSQAIRNALDVK